MLDLWLKSLQTARAHAHFKRPEALNGPCSYFIHLPMQRSFSAKAHHKWSLTPLQSARVELTDLV